PTLAATPAAAAVLTRSRREGPRVLRMSMGFLRLDRCYVEWAEPRWRRGQRLRRALIIRRLGDGGNQPERIQRAGIIRSSLRAPDAPDRRSRGRSREPRSSDGAQVNPVFSPPPETARISLRSRGTTFTPPPPGPRPPPARPWRRNT